jgi:CRISPR-associated protein Csm2
MANIQFWKDKSKKTVEVTLYSKTAESLSKKLADECEASRKKQNKRTQIRKFYDEVVRLDSLAKTKVDEWENLLPLVHMMTAKAAYARGRELVSESFVEFIRGSVEQVEEPSDLRVFATFFEAFMGFYRLHCPAN